MTVLQERIAAGNGVSIPGTRVRWIVTTARATRTTVSATSEVHRGTVIEAIQDNGLMYVTEDETRKTWALNPRTDQVTVTM